MFPWRPLNFSMYGPLALTCGSPLELGVRLWPGSCLQAPVHMTGMDTLSERQARANSRLHRLRSYSVGSKMDGSPRFQGPRPDQEQIANDHGRVRLLVRTDAEIDLLNIRAFPSQELSLQRAGTRQLGANSPILGTVLSTQATRSGPLIEHLGGAHILTDSGLIEIADELAVQVRSFPNSQRYSDTAVVVRETCLDLVGFVDLDDFHPSW